MKQPHYPKNNPANRHCMHHNKAYTHKNGDCKHNSYLRFYCHALTLHKAFKILFIQPCGYKPVMKLF